MASEVTWTTSRSRRGATLSVLAGDPDERSRCRPTGLKAAREWRRRPLPSSKQPSRPARLLVVHRSSETRARRRLLRGGKQKRAVKPEALNRLGATRRCCVGRAGRRRPLRRSERCAPGDRSRGRRWLAWQRDTPWQQRCSRSKARWRCAAHDVMPVARARAPERTNSYRLVQNSCTARSASWTAVG